MNCKKCGVPLYDGVKVCLTCGYSEEDERKSLEKQVESITVSKIKIVNDIYYKIFGATDKKIVRKLLWLVSGILLAILLIYHFFFYIDLPHGCFIRLNPALTELSNTTVKKGIVYLKQKYPSQYSDFCSNVSVIDPNISCGGFGGGCYSSYRVNPRTIDISTPYGNYINAAKVIIHETCHAIQYKENRPFDESECYGKDSVIPWNRQ